MTNNLALITGGSKRIGREIAIYLAKNSYDVAITYKNSKNQAEDLINYLQKEFKIKAWAFNLDLFDGSMVKEFADQFFSNNNCNLLVNNASIFEKSNFLQDGLEGFDENFDVHLRSPLILSRFFAQNVKEKKLLKAQIINLIDKNSVRYETSYFYYLLSKKSLLEATKMLALQLGPEIRVNAISPGYILDSVYDDDLDVEQKKKIFAKIPLQRKGDVRNILQTVDFLLNNDFINGQDIAVDGGASLNHAG